MKPINPSITTQHYPLTKKGARNKYYLVKCRLVPCDEAPSGVYQKKHSTEAGAQQDRLRLMRLFGGGSLTKEEFRDAEIAIYRLRGNAGPAKGSSLSDAVDFYIANYKGADSTPLVSVAIKEFTDKKFRTLRPDSKEEYRRYLKAFGTQFGTMKLRQLGHESVGDFIESHVSKKPCYKIIHSFLGYPPHEEKGMLGFDDGCVLPIFSQLSFACNLEPESSASTHEGSNHRGNGFAADMNEEFDDGFAGWHEALGAEGIMQPRPVGSRPP